MTEIAESKREHVSLIPHNSFELYITFLDLKTLIIDWIPVPFSFPKTLFTSLWGRAVSIPGDVGMLILLCPTCKSL
jgi:hypothetical protein